MYRSASPDRTFLSKFTGDHFISYLNMIATEKEVFHDSSLADQLQNQAMVKIPFLSCNELFELNNLYNWQHHGGMPNKTSHGIHMTIWDSSEKYKSTIRDGIKVLINTAIDRTLVCVSLLLQKQSCNAAKAA
jgi:hypothetical protein